MNQLRIKSLVNLILDIVYPRRCPVCDSILRFHRGKICAKCYHELIYVHEPRCKKCGRSIEKFEQEYCNDCSRKKHLFVSGIALITNSGAGKKSVYAIKYRNKREYVDFYTDEIVKRYSEEIRYWKPDLLIPVPLHKKKQLKRGYNQAEVIAVALGRKLKIEVDTKSLKRIANTMPQKELNELQRKKNLANAFQSDSKNIIGKNIVVIDDIYTTGSTIDECTKILIEAGAHNVHFITLSIGAGY
ncbi:MAG: ComF family protein [Lachnospiraceae bacterium]|nr:ComF family protein [Lachnospiraceae bacterium]